MIGPPELLLLTPLLVGWVMLSVAAGLYAARLGRSGFGWALFAVIFSPLMAFAFVFALGRRSADEDEERVPCPLCAEPIKFEAVRCPHCCGDLPADRHRLARRRPRET
jgi:hypothetical protein